MSSTKSVKRTNDNEPAEKQKKKTITKIKHTIAVNVRIAQHKK